MKITQTCYQCLKRLVYQAASLATEDVEARDRAIAKGLKKLEDTFSPDKVSIVIAAGLHDIIKAETGNADPYYAMKQNELALARPACAQLEKRYNSGFQGLLKLAALGNTLDFFRSADAIREDMKKEPVFAIDDSMQFKEKLIKAKTILFLADNAGEMFFDLPLLKWMRRYADVVYIVKARPVQNDLTRVEIRAAGLEHEFGKIMDTGTATPGIDFEVASEKFKKAYADADLIFAKGMGYYESLSELAACGRVFHCLVAKCQPVADSIGVPLNSSIAMMR